MSNIIQSSAVESALIQGDLSKLTIDQRISYYKNVCESVGLNCLTKPFDYITLNGKLTLYVKKEATDQLRKIHNVSITISSREKIDDIYIVTAKAKDSSGREDESTGAVNVAGLKGEALANAFLKSETKAKRRVTLSFCGLGLLDETEVETIADAKEAIPNVFENQKFEQEQLANDPGLYCPKLGKYKDQRLKDINIDELNSYVQYLRDSSAATGKPLTGAGLELTEFAEAYLRSKEPGGEASL